MGWHDNPELAAAIEQARRDGQNFTVNPWVALRGEYYKVCNHCRAKAAPEDERTCYECQDALLWAEICPDIYRKHARIADLRTGFNPWTEEEIAGLEGFLNAVPMPRTLGLMGATGRRKTTAAFAVIRAILDADRHSVLFTRATTMLKDLQARQFEADAIRRYVEPEILLLDELGERDSGLTDFQKRELQDVIEERRLDEHKLLIWTSNETLHKLRSWCHPRTWERLWEGAVLLQIGGKSSRRPAA